MKFKERKKQSKKERRATKKAKREAKKAEKAREQERLQKEADQCKANEEESLMPVERLYKYDPALQKAANKLRKDPVALERSEAAILQYRKGNKSPGKGVKKTQGVKDVFHISLKNRARIYFRERNGIFQIVGFSAKDDQKRVVAVLREIYGKE